jgi:hypothetical protein
MNYKDLPTFIFIFALGCFLRLFKFTVIPFGLNHDASLNGLVAIDLWQKLPQYTPYYTGWVGETLYHYWLIINFIFFGISPTTIKLASIIIGIITLPFFYILARNLQGKKAALFSLFFLAISGWHITMSKVGWLAILVPLFQSITFFFLYKALKQNKRWFWIGTGISLAITLNTYGAARIIPIIVIFIMFFWYIKNKELFKKAYKNIFYFIIAFLIVVFPLFQFAFKNWNTYNGRANFLSVTNRIKETHSLNPVFDNIRISIGILHYRANGDDFFVNEPLLEKIPEYLFIVGFIYILFTIRNIEQFIIASWLFLGFLPGILSVPNGNHDFSILVPVYLIIGQGANLVLIATRRFSKQISKIGYILIALILILSINDTYQQYFSKNRREIFGLYPEATIVANYMKKNINYDFYLTDNYPRDILTFITYTSGSPFQKKYTWFQNGSEFLTINRGNNGLMFFMFADPQNELLASSLQQKFLDSKKIYLPYVDDNISRIASLIVIVPPKK